MRGRIVLTAFLIVLALAFTSTLFAGDDPLEPDDGGDPLAPDDGDDPLVPDDDEKKPEAGNDEATGERAPEGTPGDGRCRDCTKKKMCEEHVEAEKEAIRRLSEFRKKKWKKEEEKERLAQLLIIAEEVAELTGEHPQYKSKKVATELGKLLTSELDIDFRIEILLLMDDRQDAETCFKYFQKSLKMKNFCDVGMVACTLAAIAYFENESTVPLVKGYFERNSRTIRPMVIDAIAYIGGRTAVSALVSLLDECGRLAAKYDWDGGIRRLWDEVTRHLSEMTPHICEVKTEGKPRNVACKMVYNDWKAWWAVNGGKYEKFSKEERDRQRWKNRISQYREPSSDDSYKVIERGWGRGRRGGRGRR